MNKDIVPTFPKIVGEERMDPAILQFVMQASIAAQTAKMRKLEESKVPVGSKSYSATIPDTVTVVKLGEPWISFTLINDGGSSVYVEVNSDEGLLDKTPVKAGESYTYNAEYPIIHTLYLQAESGGTAAVRIKGKVGKQQR